MKVASRNWLSTDRILLLRASRESALRVIHDFGATGLINISMVCHITWKHTQREQNLIANERFENVTELLKITQNYHKP